ncbi:MAG: alpha/beta hydrolase [Stackebrandtia sp.]
MASLVVPPQGEKPLLVKSWWDSLGSGERLGLLAAQPERIGGLDGVPIAIRDRANRADLDAIITAAEQRDTVPEGRPLSEFVSQASERVLRIIENRASLFGLRILKNWIERPPAVEGFEYHLIDFDVNGDGKAVVSLGDPDTAENIAVFVPGAFAAVDEALDDYARMDAMAVDAASRDGAKRTAVVRWLGYDAPNSIVPEAADPRFAVAAGADLNRFVAALRVTRDGRRSWVSMIGHSYGSTVIGVADRDHRLPVDNLVFVASPGVGVGTADKLSVGAERVWATVAPGDLIDETPPDLLGIAPTRPEFAAKVFTCADTGRPPWWLLVFGVPRDAIKAHNGYWDPGNVARDNIAAIVIGDEEAVELAGRG